MNSFACKKQTIYTHIHQQAHALQLFIHAAVLLLLRKGKKGRSGNSAQTAVYEINMQRQRGSRPTLSQFRKQVYTFHLPDSKLN